MSLRCIVIHAISIVIEQGHSRNGSSTRMALSIIECNNCVIKLCLLQKFKKPLKECLSPEDLKAIFLNVEVKYSVFRI